MPWQDPHIPSFISSTLSFIRTRSLGDLGKIPIIPVPRDVNHQKSTGRQGPFLSHSLISMQICTSSALPATLLSGQYLHSPLWNRPFSKSPLLSFSGVSFTSGSDAQSSPCSLSNHGSFLHQSGLVVGRQPPYCFQNLVSPPLTCIALKSTPLGSLPTANISSHLPT